MYEMMAGQPPFEADNEDVSKTFLAKNAFNLKKVCTREILGTLRGHTPR